MILFYLLITVLPLTRHPLFSMFVGDLTIIKYLGLICVLFAAFDLMANPRPLLLASAWQVRAFFALALLAIISYFTMTKPGAWETSPLMVYVSLLMLLFTTSALVSSRARLRWTLLATIGGMAFASLYVLREFQKFFDPGNPVRPGFVVGDPNYFTVSAVVCIPLAFALMRERPRRWERIFCGICLGLTLLAVTVAASRGGFLGLIAALAFMLWRSKNRLRNVGIVAALVLPLSLLSPISPLARLMTPTFSDTEATESRYELWSAGYRMIRENPLSGVGVGNFKALSTTYQDPNNPVQAIAHNAYIEVAAELGIPGITAFVAVLVFTFWSLGRTYHLALRARSTFLAQTALGMQGGLLGYAIAIVFVSAEYQRLFWLMVFVSACLPGLIPRKSRAGWRRSGPARGTTTSVAEGRG
jgi:putative inorganic carbon (HCO3(-)) transporter